MKGKNVTKSQSLANLKKLRLELKWSQEKLAELSGLSIRTIQRIENGETASIESLAALSSVFKVDFYSGEGSEQKETEENYIEGIKSFYFILALAVFSLIFPFATAISEPNNWFAFGMMALGWIVLLAILYFRTFDVFGEDWKKRQIEKKFRDKE